MVLGPCQSCGSAARLPEVPQIIRLTIIEGKSLESCPSQYHFDNFQHWPNSVKTCIRHVKCERRWFHCDESLSTTVTRRKGCLVQVGDGIELVAVGLQFEPYRWCPCSETWDSSRTVVVIKLRRTSALKLSLKNSAPHQWPQFWGAFANLSNCRNIRWFLDWVKLLCWV